MGVQAGKTARHDGLAKRASIVRGLIQTAQRTRLRALQRQRVKPATIRPRLHVHADRRAVACRRVIGAACQARACSSVDRVLASEARGRGFESRQARHQCSSTSKRFRISAARFCASSRPARRVAEIAARSVPAWSGAMKEYGRRGADPAAALPTSPAKYWRQPACCSSRRVRGS